MTQPRPRPPESERRLRHNVRLARLLRFLELVSGRGRWSPKTLAAELEVSERTVHRLRETLELAGVPLRFSKEENAYQVRADFRFPPLHLTDDEAIGQATVTAFADSEALQLPPGATATTRKIATTGSDHVRRILEDVTRLTQVLDLKLAGHPRQRETIGTVQRALLRRHVLVGTYRSPYEPAPVTLTLHPYRLALVKQAWYLIARPDDQTRPRTYRVVRFQSIEVVDRPAVIPDDFDLKGYLGNAWAVFRADRSFDVELRFTADAADTVLETTWHPTQQATTHPDGELTLTFTVDGLNELVRWVVGWAGRVGVVRPVELRDLVVEQHRQAIARNG
ncbi:MAG TPA: WYL domain-containing transcriptional regulator [Urbifossiella sp.]|jgi:predicted DNA-binding transcriptional regulator YafY|nr:WYL domain-containing transcriptional regulator [Urbifossiella sp.]